MLSAVKMFDRIPGLLFQCILNVCVLNCSGVTVVNNGYRNIVIAINPRIQHNAKLIENIKEMVTEASSYLYQATKHQLYFADVKILLPASWPWNWTQVQRPTTQSFEKANVIIAESYLKHGDVPYTLQFGGCGEKGRYIHFTPNFILNDEMTSIYCPKGKVFVHEWAHLRWGVFSEYNDLVPFYLSESTIAEATRCSFSIKGVIAECRGSSCSPCIFDESTRLPNKDCTFFPMKNQPSSSSIMYLQGLPSVVEFCDNATHNVEAPNMQNRMCNYRSTWDVISKSEDFRNVYSAHTGSVKPTFTLLQAKERVLCLVLDVSGSMSQANRIVRLRQAAEIFLLQIAETGSQVGIVTFNSMATIQTHLRKIDDDKVREELVKLLPTSARGGTSICAGVEAGFEVVRGNDSSTNGDEIVVLTDGQDNRISACFPEVERSGAVIHTIALGPSAAEQLEELSNMTGGLQFAATDNLDTSGLIDSFTGLVSGNSDSSQQAIQIGTWIYSIWNPGRKQVITVIVTSRPADAQIPPIKVNGYFNRRDSTSPMISNVEVSQGFLPVLNANVTAIIERPSGLPIELKLSDDGLGADIVRNDGIYSKYFLNFHGSGRYSVKVRVQGIEGTTRITVRKRGQGMCLPGYSENGHIKLNEFINEDNEEDFPGALWDFIRVQAGGAISLPVGTPVIDFPPSQIRDLQSALIENKIDLEWTAPGGDYDQGSASRYEIRMSDKLLQLRDNFTNALLINMEAMIPQPFGSRETETIHFEHPNLQNGASIYFAIRAYDKINQSSEVSNIIKVSYFVPLAKDHWYTFVWLQIVIAIVGCFIVLLIIWIVGRKIKMKASKQELMDNL
ncbi:calcium-activated chloride channel regulator 1-like isoform X2 [Narcine bancroftii]|uniref:calcium-activated chloride channel regulator 1-like isoform X2 n=1 Tax=Narcine bancroftii TaxID=1343680 RepID=UPI003831A110